MGKRRVKVEKDEEKANKENEIQKTNRNRLKWENEE